MTQARIPWKRILFIRLAMRPPVGRVGLNKGATQRANQSNFRDNDLLWLGDKLVTVLLHAITVASGINKRWDAQSIFSCKQPFRRSQTIGTSIDFHCCAIILFHSPMKTASRSATLRRAIAKSTLRVTMSS